MTAFCGERGLCYSDEAKNGAERLNALRSCEYIKFHIPQGQISNPTE